MTYQLDKETEEQISQCLNLLNSIFGKSLLGVYLYGSAIVGGLQKYSDIDLFVISDRSTSHEEKTKLVASLLQISGVYMKSTKLPIEMTIVEKSKINPWHYPPHFDFQYGDWLRNQFEKSIIEPWPSKEMPDLALLVTQVLLASKTLQGPKPQELLCKVPYQDMIVATTHSLNNLGSELDSDTRNVLLAYARIWSRLETDAIRSKTAAANWAIDHLPEEYRPVLTRAKAICTGEVNEYWDDIQPLIEPCADFIVSQINKKISILMRADNTDKSIRLSE